MPAPTDRVTALNSESWTGRVTRAEIDLDAIAFNVRSLCSLLSGAELMAVVKGNAYGHGAVAVARTALDHGATRLGVYTMGEGVELRQAGIHCPVLVFGPFQRDEARDACRYDLTPTISSIEGGEMLQRHTTGRPIRFHLKIDTGLHRSGVSAAEATDLLHGLQQFPSLQREGLYTHFACADEPERDCTSAQLSLFLRTARELEAAGFAFPLKHAANSAATLSRTDTHLDLVRAGISLYGYYPSSEIPPVGPLHPALSLRSRVARVHSIPAGAGVGYGNAFVAQRRTYIALAPVGYGDGLPRSLGDGRGRVLVHGTAAPIVGRVSMDQITVDVTEIENVVEGDDVVLIGAQGESLQDAAQLAAQAGTISYDILTGLLPRVPRRYVGDPRLVVQASIVPQISEASASPPACYRETRTP
ncbi:MAG: alanine racemase [Chloroflexota bacterium]|nr:alanine racemase [Chloroflexota bacterium]